jgi:hypothetical protein
MPNNTENTEKRPTERVVEYVSEKAKGINWTNIILPVGAVFLGFEFLKSQGLIKTAPPTSTTVTPECPRGSKYSRGLFGDCDPNYLMCGWLQENCCCMSSGTPVSSPMHQSNYDQFPTNDRIQLSLEKWQPLSKMEKLKLGIVSKR